MSKLIFACVVLISSIFLSCRGFLNSTGRTKKVSFTADSAIFKDSLYPEQSVSHSILLGLRNDGAQQIVLKEGEVSEIKITKPTFFTKQSQEFLIFPGEKIFIKGEYMDYVFSNLNGNDRRNRELNFFKTFQSLQKYPVPPRVPDYTHRNILDFEKDQIIKIKSASSFSKLLFDSLIKVYGVSKKFKRYSRNYLPYKYDYSLLSLYQLYRDTLKKHGLYRNKILDQLSSVNRIKKFSKFNSNARYLVNEIESELFPDNHMGKFDENEFCRCFDSVETYFRSIPRAYLLSRLMYSVYYRGMKIPESYERKYKKYVIPKAYREIVYAARSERRHNQKLKPNGVAQIILPESKTEYKLDSILAKYKGKYVLIDLWASWCGPCLMDAPYFKQLGQKFSEDKIAFLNISVDKNISRWQQAIADDKKNHFLWTNSNQSLFLKQFELNILPRYVLLDREGKIIMDDAPRPSNPELDQLLGKLLSEN